MKVILADLTNNYGRGKNYYYKVDTKTIENNQVFKIYEEFVEAIEDGFD